MNAVENPLILIDESKLRLSAILHEPSIGKHKRIAVLCHGMMSHKNGAKHKLISNLFTYKFSHPTLRFDFAARGESEGTPEDILISVQLQNLHAAMQYVNKHRRENEVVLMGSSFGALTALLYTYQHLVDTNIVGLILVALPNRSDFTAGLLSEDELRAWKEARIAPYDGGLLPYALHEELGKLPSIEQLLSAMDLPLLMVHGEKDELFPSEEMKRLFKLAPSQNKQLVIVKDGDHSLSEREHRKVLQDAISSWYQSI